MFEGDLEELSTADLLTAASGFGQIQERAAVRTLEAALAFADRNAVILREPLPGSEQIHVYGGDGCPGVAEFAPIEFGAVMGMSTGAAAALIGEALALRHRLPRLWAAVLAGDAVAWRARKVAHACLSLSMEACPIVDRRVVGIVNTVTPRKLATIVTAALWEANPELAKAQAEAAARARGVFVAQSDDNGTKRFWVRAAAGDVIRFDATIDDLARALKTLGDTDSLDERRAKAIGWISDPAAAHQLLEVARYLARVQPTCTTPDNTAGTAADTAADDGPAVPDRGDPDDPADQDEQHARATGTSESNEPSQLSEPIDPSEPITADEGAFTRQMLAGTLPARLAAIKRQAYSNGIGAGSGRRNRHSLYVHLTDHALTTGDGVLRVEELGPLLASQLTELLGHDQIVVKPVIDLHDEISVHSYEIPDRIRERVRLRHPVDMFPYGTAEATTRMDQDHITPYDTTGPPGEPGQTTTDNLIPQARLHHRAKTFGGWRCRRLPTGAVDWISPHGFRFLVDHTGTHPVPSA